MPACPLATCPAHTSCPLQPAYCFAATLLGLDPPSPLQRVQNGNAYTAQLLKPNRCLPSLNGSSACHQQAPGRRQRHEGGLTPSRCQPGSGPGSFSCTRHSPTTHKTLAPRTSCRCLDWKMEANWVHSRNASVLGMTPGTASPNCTACHPAHGSCSPH